MLDEDHFKKVLEEAFEQMSQGKGRERHGHGLKFDEQPWKTITDNVGLGFVLGQAIKKIMELKSFEVTSAAWKREALGAMVYLTMAIMYVDYRTQV